MSTATLDLASRLTDLPRRRGRAPWPDHEYVKGWGVFGLPFDSGHVLALRVFPENDFGPYVTVWHRDPEGRWSIFVDGDRLETACPRYYGPACTYTGFATITVAWTGPASLRVTVDRPALEWTLTAYDTTALRALNAAGKRMPLITWRWRPLVRAREKSAAALGLGRLPMTGVMPSGHTGTLMPQQMYFVARSAATLDGRDLGRPTRLDTNPRIGDVALPARGVLAVGQAMWEIPEFAPPVPRPH
ncbi:hypothetical protein [Nocardia violaceofusca]|uniref:hypothetical protein n=1 Tax=Nocardia violaceofusca TaxID=941182 RepID=UPI000A67EF63|nr:hypothetical protein [Nocardia violaceofusca]